MNIGIVVHKSTYIIQEFSRRKTNESLGKTNKAFEIVIRHSHIFTKLCIM